MTLLHFIPLQLHLIPPMLLLHDKPENGKVGGKEELYQVVQFLTTAAPENTMVHHSTGAEFKLNHQYQT